MKVPHEYEVVFMVEVSPEEGDTAESLAAYVHDLAAEWIGDAIDHWEVRPVWSTASEPRDIERGSCQHCGRGVERDPATDLWVDPEATGDDEIWRETCDSNDTFEAYHEVGDGLREHFESHHHPYNEDGRVIDSDSYLRLVHIEDHDTNEGISIPHTHDDGGGKVEAERWHGEGAGYGACGILGCTTCT